MNRGKHVCKILKEIRQQIADKNEIEYVTSECHFQGECKGTCPKCEAEVRYLESELNKRKQLGKAATIAGISFGVVGSFAACNYSPKQEIVAGDIPVVEMTEQDTIEIPAIPMDTFATETEKKVVPIARSIDAVVGGIEDEVFIPIDTSVVKTENKNNDFVYMVGGIEDEVRPEFQGGNEELYKFISNNLVYPKEAQEKEIEGRVIVRFFVEKDGSLSDIEVVKGIGGGCNEEVIRVMKMMPKWKAGQYKGEDARYPLTIPVNFKLED